MKILQEIISHEQIIEQHFNSCLKKGHGGLFTYFNQHCFNIYYSSGNYRNILKNFHVYNDGVGMYYVIKALGRKHIDKLNATNLNQKLLDICSSNNLSVFVIGGDFERETVQKALKSEQINCLGYNNGFFGEDENEAVLNKIAGLNPKVTFIGMGVPKQELFAIKVAEKLPGSIIVCVGNFWEFYFKKIKRAPVILHNSGFEWLFRLLTEPGRLYKRYLFGIPLFIFRIIKLKLNNETSVPVLKDISENKIHPSAGR